jgi:drug/metabolite transporter superfamily protein YnfA
MVMVMDKTVKENNLWYCWWNHTLYLRNNSYITTFKFWKGMCRAYGGFFIISSILWGVMVDKKRLDKFQIIGSMVAVLGAVIIFYGPR